MAEGLGSAGANTALDALTAAYPWVQLHVGAPGAAGTSNVAVETDRQTSSWAAAAVGAVTTDADLVWTSVGGSEDYTHFTLWSASTAGAFGYSGTITANPVVAGDSFTIQAGDLDVSFTLAS